MTTLFKRGSWSQVSRLIAFDPELASQKIPKGYQAGADLGIVQIVMGILVRGILKSALADTYGSVLKSRLVLPDEIGEQFDESKALVSAQMVLPITRSIADTPFASSFWLASTHGNESQKYIVLLQVLRYGTVIVEDWLESFHQIVLDMLVNDI